MKPAWGLFFLATLLPFAASAEIYRYVDENGVIRYSDSPPTKDAKPVELPPVQTFSTEDTGSYESTDEEETPASILIRESAAYTGIRLTSPSPEQVYNQGNPEVIASAQVEPGLADGDRVVFMVDGKAVAAPEGRFSLALDNLARGSHTLQAVVMNSQDAVQVESETINFHLHQPSQLRPAPPNAMPKLP